MERRIKFIHALTIGVIVAFALSQGYWLFSRYRLALQEREDVLFASIVAAADEDVELRSRHPQKQVPQVVTQRYYTYTQTTKQSRTDSAMTLNLTIAFGEPKRLEDRNSLGISKGQKDLASSSEANGQMGLESLSIDNFRPDSAQAFNFQLEDADHINGELTDRAVKLFQVNMQHPFAVEGLDSLLRKREIAALHIDVDSLADSLLWEPVLQRHGSLLRPRIAVTLPFDILQHRVVRVEAAIALSPLLRGMSRTLAASFLLSLLLVFCLTYQIMTIRKQRRVEELRREFVDTMIHELKRPISTLKMCVSFMSDNRMMADEEGRRTILESSHHELDNLTAYFTRLREITIGDAAQIPLTLSRFGLRSLLQECIAGQNVPAGKRVRMLIDEAPEMEIKADRMHLGNVVSNLLENAIKYSGEEVDIHLSYITRADGTLCLTVSDNGYGIARADLPHIFSPFFRSKRTQTQPGIGLGLSYVKLLVEAHNGQIKAESEEGKGTTFTIQMKTLHSPSLREGVDTFQEWKD